MYKTVKVEVSLENAAFYGDSMLIVGEAIRLSDKIAAFMTNSATKGFPAGSCQKLVDCNGNSVGYIGIVESKEEPTCSC